jgi:hypothetical protein
MRLISPQFSYLGRSLSRTTAVELWAYTGSCYNVSIYELYEFFGVSVRQDQDYENLI